MDRIKVIALLALLAGCAAQPGGVSISSALVPNPSVRGPVRSARPPVTTQTIPPADTRLDDVERALRDLRDRLASDPQN